MEWLRDNPAISNHRSANYKGREVKLGLVAEKAQMTYCTYVLLDRWIKSFRNYYVKLTKSKSVLAAESLTDRQSSPYHLQNLRPHRQLFR